LPKCSGRELPVRGKGPSPTYELAIFNLASFGPHADKRATRKEPLCPRDLCRHVPISITSSYRPKNCCASIEMENFPPPHESRLIIQNTKRVCCWPTRNWSLPANMDLRIGRS